MHNINFGIYSLCIGLFFLFLKPLAAQDQIESPALSTDSLNELLDLASRHVGEGKAAQALAVYMQVLSYQEVLPLRTAWSLASVLHDLGRLEEAERFLDFYQERVPSEDLVSISAATSLRETIQASLRLVVACTSCDEQGFLYVVHDLCKGSGEQYLECPTCHGNKVHICPRCQGQGVVIQRSAFGKKKYFQCPLCRSKRYIKCTSCNETGEISQTCEACQGQGYLKSRQRCLHEKHEKGDKL